MPAFQRAMIQAGGNFPMVATWRVSLGLCSKCHKTIEKLSQVSDYSKINIIFLTTYFLAERKWLKISFPKHKGILLTQFQNLCFFHQVLQTHQNVMLFVSISGSATFTADLDPESPSWIHIIKTSKSGVNFQNP